MFEWILRLAGQGVSAQKIAFSAATQNDNIFFVK